jgi:DNA-binding transcriptional ArsR family regulator
MAARFRESYQFETGLEQAVVDLVRVGATGFGSGVRQLATRLVRSVPPGVSDPEAFRKDLHEALSLSAQPAALRFAPGELPRDSEATHPLAFVDPMPSGSGLTLPADAAPTLRDVVEEHQKAELLFRAGISPTHTLLLSGPPGVGKTMTARWLAQEIGVPLVTMDLSSVVSSYLGNSGRNIRSVLDYAKTGRCVLLLDEFDAIAKKRDDDTDIGELKRVVNVVLVELDRWPQSSLLVAATNHPQLLDGAVERRFDHHVELGLPSEAERLQILLNLALGCQVNEDVLQVSASVMSGFTGSDLTRLWNNVRRRSVLRGRPCEEELLEEVAWGSRAAGSDRDRLWLMLAEHLGMSVRQIAARAGVSHPTVSSALKRARAAR